MNGIRIYNKVYRIGIIGCGRISKKHIESINHNQLFDLVSVCDKNKSKLEHLNLKSNLNTYQDFELMISSENLDVVSVLTDSGSHENIINKIAGKIKNIIVEKPFVLTTSGAKRVVKKCIENSTRIFVVHQNRLNKTVEKLFELKNQNFFGKIFLCSVNLYWSRSDEYYNSDRWRGKWISDGGAIANQGIHYIDIIHKLLGDPYSISADSSRALNKIETEDTALINFKYKDGCLVNFQLTTAIRPKNIEGSISVFSEKGFYIIGGEALNELKAVKLLNYKANIDENYVIEDVYGKGHQIFYDKISKSIKNNSESEFDGINFINQIRLLNAIYTSIETSSKIIFDNRKDYKTKLGTYEN